MAIDFLTPTRGFMATRGGELRRTRDGGRTWQLAGHEPGLASLSFLSRSHGFALNKHGRVLETRDGGRSWHTRYAFRTSVGYGQFAPGEVSFLNAEDGWVSPFQFGRIFRTTDGGSSWQVVSRGCVDCTEAFSFPDRSTGFMVRGYQPSAGSQDKDYYETTNGGATWRRVTCASGTSFRRECRQSTLSGGGYVTPTGLAFRDRATGLLVLDRGGIVRTTDGGRHWNNSLSTDDQWFVTSISWASRNVVYALTHDGIVIRSEDAGADWNRINPAGPGAPPAAISFASPIRGIAVQSPELLVPAGIEATTDGGKTWHHFASVRVLDAQLVRASPGVVWAIGVRDLPSGDAHYYLLRSADDGAQWRRMPSPPALDVATLSFPTPRVGFLADFSNRLFRTGDSGRSWHLVGLNRNVRDAVFLSPHEALRAGDVGLLRSTDSGHSWHAVRVVPGMRFSNMAVLDSKH